LLQFVQTFLIWIIAEHLDLSAVLAVVAFAMTLASTSGSQSSARMRVQSYAVWSAVVFVLNVMAFLLMGMQARSIVADMPSAHLGEAVKFALVIVVLVIVTRLMVCIGFNRVQAVVMRRRGQPEPATIKQGILAGWCGMRGLVTLATAFALPADFPQRSTVVLTAFAVVLATLVLQGLTLSPIIKRLGLDRRDETAEELRALRSEISHAGWSELEGLDGQEVKLLRGKLKIEQDALDGAAGTSALETYRKLVLRVVAAQRIELHRLWAENRLTAEEYNLLLEEIDWRELSVLPDAERRIEEI
jgi:CPA1 family monovalent cation:H+ antiporter